MADLEQLIGEVGEIRGRQDILIDNLEKYHNEVKPFIVQCSKCQGAKDYAAYLSNIFSGLVGGIIAIVGFVVTNADKVVHKLVGGN